MRLPEIVEACSVREVSFLLDQPGEIKSVLMRSLQNDQPVCGWEVLNALHESTAVTIAFPIEIAKARGYNIGGLGQGGYADVRQTIRVSDDITIGHLEVETRGMSLDVEEGI